MCKRDGSRRPVGVRVVGVYRVRVSHLVRRATLADVSAIAAIYGHAVRDSVATFDVVEPPPSYWQEKLSSAALGDHVVVVEDGCAVVVGYAYSTAFRPRPAYAGTRKRRSTWRLRW